MAGRGSAVQLVEVAPEKSDHKESLAIYKLFTNFADMKITRLLNHKYQHKLPLGHRFSTRLVERKWEEMVETNDEIYVEVSEWKGNNSRVTRVLKWAKKDDEKNPL